MWLVMSLYQLLDQYLIGKGYWWKPPAILVYLPSKVVSLPPAFTYAVPLIKMRVIPRPSGRGGCQTERDAEAQRFVTVFEKAGVTVTLSGIYSSWPPNPNSALLGIMKGVYKNLYGKEPEVAAIHAGLETSVAGVKYPGMDMISIGTTLQNVHTPDERLEVATVKKAYDLIAATLEQIK